MKKLHILIPSLVATASMPFIGLVGCAEPTPEPEPEVDDCFAVTALEQSTFIIQTQSDPTDPWFQPNIDYSFNNGSHWITYDYYNTNPITIEKGTKVIFKGNNPNGFDAKGGKYRPNFAFTGLVELSGNIMSLLDNGACDMKTIPCDGCFSGLFRSWTDYKENWAIKSIEHLSLPATTLTSGCYEWMFACQGNLITPMPTLPSLNLANNCYDCMFLACSSLTTTPYLPATTLADHCYARMFFENSSLKVKQAPLSSDEHEGLIFKYTNEISANEVDSMFYGISTSSEYKKVTPEPGYSYYWYI